MVSNTNGEIRAGSIPALGTEARRVENFPRFFLQEIPSLLLSNLGLIVKNKKMKHLTRFINFAVLICVCNLFTSCEDDGGQSINNDNKYVGEWRPVRYATTYDDEVITDEDEYEEEDLYKEWNFGWLILSKNSFRSATDMIKGSYTVKNDKIRFNYNGFGGKYSDEYDIISLQHDELTIIDSDGHCEIFTLEKFQEHAINTQDIVGQWRASKMITYHKNGNMGMSTGSHIEEYLNGLEYIDITNTDITLLGKNRNCSYYISNNDLHLTPNLSEFSIASAHIKDVKNNRLYIYFVSLDKNQKCM